MSYQVNQLYRYQRDTANGQPSYRGLYDTSVYLYYTSNCGGLPFGAWVVRDVPPSLTATTNLNQETLACSGATIQTESLTSLPHGRTAWYQYCGPSSALGLSPWPQSYYLPREHTIEVMSEPCPSPPPPTVPPPPDNPSPAPSPPPPCGLVEVSGYSCGSNAVDFTVNQRYIYNGFTAPPLGSPSADNKRPYYRGETDPSVYIFYTLKCGGAALFDGWVRRNLSLSPSLRLPSSYPPICPRPITSRAPHKSAPSPPLPRIPHTHPLPSRHSLRRR